jgi:hypothetical protein
MAAAAYRRRRDRFWAAAAARRRDDDVVHGHREAAAGLADHVSSQPARSLRAMGRDHELVRGKPAEGVLDRQEWVGVSDDALGVDAHEPEPLQATPEPGLGPPTCLLVVRGPVPQPGVERRGDDEHLGASSGGTRPDRVEQLGLLARLVRDDENPLWLSVLDLHR